MPMEKFVTFLKSQLFITTIISLILLSIFSPILSLLWLCITTSYLLYQGSFQNIYKIWGVTLSIWYLIFSTSLSELTIIIGFQHTKVILDYLMENPFLFKNLCFQTVYLLDILSAKLGFPIRIPAVINIFGS